MAVYLFIVLLLIWVWWRARRNFVDGLCLGVALLVCMSTHLRFTLPQPWPALTIHRLILLVLLCFWLRDRNRKQNFRSLVLKKPFVFWSIATGLSMVFTTIHFIPSFKDYLELVFEIFLFFVMVGTTVRDRESGLRLLKAVWWGFVIIAIFAVVEKYTRFNPVDRYLGYVRWEKGLNDVQSTLPQRILLGTAMAMAWPLAYALSILKRPEFRGFRLLVVLTIPLFLACCYFGMSRGPWLAAVLAGIALAVFGSAVIRKRLLIAGVAGVLVLIARPGVLGTFSGMAEVTVDRDSQKGGTFRYRIELWKIAWSQINSSPLRILVGNGLGAGRESEVTVALSYREKDFVVDSWDNHFAYDLYQSGLLGLAGSLWLYGGAGLIVFRLWRRAKPVDRDLLACCLASMGALIFMMTNVLIFAKQISFAFWSIFAIAVACGTYYRAQSPVAPGRRSRPRARPEAVESGGPDTAEFVGKNTSGEPSREG